MLALLTVATTRGHRAVAVATAATATALGVEPYIHGDAVSFTSYSLPEQPHDFRVDLPVR